MELETSTNPDVRLHGVLPFLDKESVQFIRSVQKDGASEVCMKVFRSLETFSIEQTLNQNKNQSDFIFSQLSLPPASAFIVKRFNGAALNAFCAKLD